MNIRLRDIKLFDLDSQTVLQVTKFVRHARKHEGALIQLNDPLVIRKVVHLGMNTSDEDLRMQFLAIHRSLKQRYGGQVNVPPLADGGKKSVA